MVAGSPFTLAYEDLYDYLRCPKIVSLKAYRYVNPRPKSAKKERTYDSHKSAVIGIIGETATKAVFSKSIEDEEATDVDITEKPIITDVSNASLLTARIDLAKRGIELDAEMEQILKNTLDGLSIIRESLGNEYGNIRIIGRGETRSGQLLGLSKPDFVAIASKREKSIIIEVKNTAKPSGEYEFQASYYNTITKREGVAVLEERMEDGKNTIVPTSFRQSVSDTLLIYPRLGTYNKIINSLDINTEIIEEVWRAKQLGFMGKSPHTGCGSSCAHHRLGDLPEDNVEVAVPLPLVFSKGMVEYNKFDLDMIYLKQYLFRKGLSSVIRDPLIRLTFAERIIGEKFKNMPNELEKRLGDISDQRNELFSMFYRKTGIPSDILKKAMSTYWIGAQDDIYKLMANDILPWEKILGQERFKTTKARATTYARQLYTLPINSLDFVKRSWHRWH